MGINSTMDYAELIKEEARRGHAAFHEFALTLSRASPKTFFFFFEGDDDPAFYMGHIHNRLADREASCFICNGRVEVLKAHELVHRDGRATDRTNFFIDKDHADYCEPERPALGPSVFETSVYSIENYLVCTSVLRRYWSERLHLSHSDERLQGYVEKFEKLYIEFVKRSRLVMAAILLGRGVGGRKQVKLNLNNVNFDKIINIDFLNARCSYEDEATKTFMAATNMLAEDIEMKSCELRAAYRKHLKGSPPKRYIRGKFELWMFCKFLAWATAELSERKRARESGKKRATPVVPLTTANCIEVLAPLAPCPQELTAFLNARLAS